MKKIIGTIIITLIVVSFLYLVTFRIYLGEPQNSITFNIFEKTNQNWFYKLTRYVPKEFAQLIHYDKIERFDVRCLTRVNYSASHSSDEYYLVIDENNEEWLCIKCNNKINLEAFNLYNKIRTGYITRNDVVIKYCDLYADSYENKNEGFRLKIENKRDIDSINFLFPYKAHLDSSKIFKNYDLIPKGSRSEDDLHSVVYWYYCGGYYSFDFFFKKNSIVLEKVVVKNIGLSGKECMLL